jgi:hypothetical protein
MGTWFWQNIPLMLVFFSCTAGIPLWLTLTRWRAEVEARHAEIAANASPAPVHAELTPVLADEAGVPVRA